ncbi:MAG: hypothetical protein ACJA1R_000552 [Flavobacteriales bacterium]|jgi:hypothetical protein
MEWVQSIEAWMPAAAAGVVLLPLGIWGAFVRRERQRRDSSRD